MIQEIYLKNFRPHKSLKLKDLHPNLNVIIGDTGTGKTSIFRALRLLFNNEPSGGAKLYKFKEKTELLIKSIVDNNEIIRKAKSYKIKSKKKDLTLTAFGKSVPEPIKNIIDLKEINWQLQIQPHFLILDNGGTVARFLNPIIGSDESDLLIKETKKQIEESRSQIKSLNLVITESEKIVEKFQNISKFTKRIDHLQKHIYLLQDLHSQNFSVEKKLNSALEIESQLIDSDKIEESLNRISEIESKYKEIKKKKEIISQIKLNLNRLENIENSYIPMAFENYINKIIKIEKKKAKETSVQEEIDKVKSLLKSWGNIKETLEEGIEEYTKLEAKWKKEFSFLKICPFCDQKIKQGMKDAESHLYNRPTHIRKKSNLQIR